MAVLGKERCLKRVEAALERLKELCGDFQLIMLSATVGQPEEVAKFFSSNKVVKIIKADTTKKMEIKVIYPEPIPGDKRIAEKIFASQETAARLRTIMELIKTVLRSSLITAIPPN
jgi:ATP-dependent Lhr-like helicase